MKKKQRYRYFIPTTLLFICPSILFCQKEIDSTDVMKMATAFAEEYYIKNKYDTNDFIGKDISGKDVTLLNGNRIRLDSLVKDNRAVVINFWFTHCSPCIEEMPLLNTLAADYVEQPVLFLAMTYEEKQEVSEFLNKISFDFEHLVSEKDIMDSLGVRHYPLTLILDPTLKVVDVAPAFNKKLSQNEDLHEAWLNDIKTLINHQL